MDSLEIIERELDAARVFSDIFGSATTPAEIKTQFAAIARTVHPDAVPESSKKAAERVFRKLLLLRNQALDALVNDTFNETFRCFELMSRRGTYLLNEEPFAKGEHSIIYQGHHEGKKVLAKISREPRNNPFLEREARLLTESRPPAFAFVPKILDTFLFDHDTRRFRVNIMPHLEDLVSLAELKEYFPSGLDPRDMGWIFRRVLGASLTARTIGKIHGAITPEHILVNPISHDPLYLGWGHAKESPSDAEDVKAAAEILLWLSSDVPTTLGSLIERCLGPTEARPSARTALDLYTGLVRGLWGKQYRPLHLPT